MQINQLIYTSFKPITPSDSVPLTCAAIYVGSAGNLAISSGIADTPAAPAPPVTLIGVLPGKIYAIQLEQGRVMLTGTTAAGLVALN